MLEELPQRPRSTATVRLLLPSDEQLDRPTRPRVRRPDRIERAARHDHVALDLALLDPDSSGEPLAYHLLHRIQFLLRGRILPDDPVPVQREESQPRAAAVLVHLPAGQPGSVQTGGDSAT